MLVRRAAWLFVAFLGCSSSYRPEGSGSGAGPTRCDASAVCCSAADCPTKLSGECRTVNCDPTGENTSPDVGLLGCYSLAKPTDTPCGGGVCLAGVCCEDAGVCK